MKNAEKAVVGHLKVLSQDICSVRIQTVCLHIVVHIGI
jgi:hypothetical protein